MSEHYGGSHFGGELLEHMHHVLDRAGIVLIVARTLGGLELVEWVDDEQIVSGCPQGKDVEESGQFGPMSPERPIIEVMIELSGGHAQSLGNCLDPFGPHACLQLEVEVQDSGLLDGEA